MPKAGFTALTPVQGFVRAPVFFSGEIGDKVDAFDLLRSVDVFGVGGGSRKDVEGADRIGVDLARRDRSLPLHHEWHPHAALIELSLLTT